MGGVIPRFQHGGPVTYEVVEAVKGGQLVEARAGSKIGVAAAGSTKVLGVATRDAQPTSVSGVVDGAYGPVITVEANVSQYVAVGGNGEHWPVTYAANAAFGDPLIAAANGQVTPAGATPDARSVIGRCTEPAGVLAGAVGLAKIYG